MPNLYEMSIDSLLYNFRNRMKSLLIDEARKHQMDAQPGWVIDLIEDEIMPAVEKIVDWEPSDSEIVETNSCGTPWHDGCRQNRQFPGSLHYGADRGY